MNRNNKLIEVCDKCLTASCWYGEFMCTEAKSAGTTMKTIGELTQMSREHPENWSDEKLEAVFGDKNPHGYRS